MGNKFSLKFIGTIVLIVLFVGFLLTVALILTGSRGLIDPSNFTPPSSSILDIIRKLQWYLKILYALGLESNKEILEKNGTAVDAAVAVTFCIGVKAPQSSGIGGGAFATIYIGKKMYAANGRECAPNRAEVSLYKNRSDYIYGGKAVGVMGEVALLWDMHQRFGRLKWSELVEPSRKMAEDGFEITAQLGISIEIYQKALKRDKNLLEEFSNEKGELLKQGDKLKRPNLAKTLKIIEDQGKDGFYKGDLAEKIVNEINHSAEMEFFTKADLENYTVDWTEPISYKLKRSNLTLYSLGFPSGAPVVAMALGILEKFGSKDYRDLPMNEIAQDQHILAEVLKFASAHRAQVSDPNFNNNTELLERILSEQYAEKLYNKVQLTKTQDNAEYYGATYANTDEHGTAHTSILSPDGDAVSLTSTVNYGFGAAFVGNETGIIYNNQLDDFSAVVKRLGVYGLPVNIKNKIQPGKRPASSMSPIILLNDQGQVEMINGGSGGIRIVPAVIGTTWRSLYRNMNVKESSDFPRMMPNFGFDRQLLYEHGMPAGIIRELNNRGHKLDKLTTGYWAAISNIRVHYTQNSTNMDIWANADFRKLSDSAGF